MNAEFWNPQYPFGLCYLDSETRRSELLKVLQKYTDRPSILDLGCGKGSNLPLVRGKYRNYHGVDISSEAVKRASSLGRPNTSYVKADVLHYQPRESYDAILLFGVLYYFPMEKVPQFLHRMSSYLPLDGVMIVEAWDGSENIESITFAIYSSGLAIGEEATRVLGDTPRKFYI